jgi:hypothetical protein
MLQNMIQAMTSSLAVLNPVGAPTQIAGDTPSRSGELRLDLAAERQNNRRTNGHAVRRAAVMLSLVATAVANAAHADEGLVIWKNFDCGYFVLQLKAGYGLYELVTGPFPNDSDVLEGELTAAGEHHVNNKTADVPSTIFLDTYSAKRAVISTRIPAKCKANPNSVEFEAD